MLDQNTLQLVHNRIEADKPHNALLLRSDIHDLFDDYQFGYMVVRMKPIL